MRRRQFLGLVAAATASSVSPALPQKRPFQIGWLAFGQDAQSLIDRSLREALAEGGLVDGRSIDIVYRFAKGNSAQLSPLANELVDLKPDILVGIGGDVIKALSDASRDRIRIRDWTGGRRRSR